MTEHDKKISGVQAPANPVQQSAPSEGRRRLMKGALAAPAVMTLMNGRLAMASMGACADKPPSTEAGNVATMPLTDDVFQRTAVTANLYQDNSNPNNPVFYHKVGSSYYDANGSLVITPPTGLVDLNQTVSAYKLDTYQGMAVSPSCWASLPE